MVIVVSLSYPRLLSVSWLFAWLKAAIGSIERDEPSTLMDGANGVGGAGVGIGLAGFLVKFFLVRRGCRIAITVMIV